MSEPRRPEEAVAGFLRRRRDAVARHASQVAVDYVAVAGDVLDPARRLLEIHFVPAADPAANDAKHQVLDGLSAGDVHFFKDEVPEDGLFELDFRRPGTGTIESAGIDVTGTSTVFGDEVTAGDVILAAGERRRVTSVETNTALTVNAPFPSDLAPGTAFELAGSRVSPTLDATRVEEVLTLRVRFAGETDSDRRLSGQPIFTVELTGPSEIDPFFSRASFSVDLEPPLVDECTPGCPPRPPEGSPSAIDYLARDYASFRQVLIEHLGQRLPQWTERSAADQLVALTEVLADAADQVSYFQDAVATEAYLGTARRRISVRRHARLVGHRMAEGTNARAWVRLASAGDGVGIQPGTGTFETAGTTVTGTGTRFVTELRAGDAIRAAGETRLAVAVASDTELELDEPFTPAGLAPGTAFRVPSLQAGTGTIASSGTAVTGTGTAFTTELVPGDRITAAGQTRTVAAVDSDTELTLATTFVPNLPAGTAFEVPAVQAGTGTVTSAGTTVTGSGTAFGTELTPGARITAAGEHRFVVRVVSDTELEVDAPFVADLAVATAFETPATQAGTGTVEAAGTRVTGTGTFFTTEVRVGDVIRTDAGQARTVVRVTSDTELEVDAPFGLLPGTGFLRPGAQLLTRVPGQSAAVLSTASPELRQFLAGGPVIFETVHPIELYQVHNAMPIYTWGSPEYALPQGTTRTALEGSFPNLVAGDVVIFEEVKGRDTGLAEDADPERRHAVRLTRVAATQDPLGDDFLDPPVPDALTEIEWDAADALPFTLAVSKVLADGTVVPGIALARGNVVLADHGRMVGGEAEALTVGAGRFRPRLVHPELTHRVPYDHRAALGRPAAEAFAQEPADAVAVIDLSDDERVWNLRRDLLASDRFAADFVVEMEDDAHAVLRFGDGTLGRAPAPGTVLVPRYRVGRGVVGNLGAESLVHLVSDAAPPVTAVVNPLAARGGREPETLAEVRRAAPGRLLGLEACTQEQEFAKVAAGHPEVSRAAARLRWTGSWHRLVVAVERSGGADVDEAFQAELRAFLEDFRLGGWELVVEPLAFVGLDILLTVHVAPGAVAAAVERRLLEVFSNRTLADGRRGFFHPDNFTFGQSVYLSRVVDTAMAVDGVVALDTDETPPRLNRFRRFGEPSRGELEIGQIRMTGTEVARVDNDPDAPENGRIRFFMEGGR